MTKKQTILFISVVLAVCTVLIVGIVLTNGLYVRDTDIQESMQDAVLHEGDKIDLFGLMVNPGLISAYIVTGVILLFAAIVRIFVIPRFKRIPGKFQLVLEEAVGMFDNMAKTNSPHRNNFLGAYIFAAAAYIFIGTLFELVGFPWVSAAGKSVTLPAPLSDINGAIALGCLSYLVILAGGIVTNRARGLGRTLKEFSLPISMSFRLFGALLSGLLVSELVYSYLSLSFVLPVVVGVLFTVLHALVQAYVLATLTALIYGEVCEPYVKKTKGRSKEKKTRKTEVTV
ncbi:MAG TPA: F0F1 ATP synthase subunit A [Firmicutes bacterium]|nr:F0F1 ATP synthase subunit A [Bacillota bacterium]